MDYQSDSSNKTWYIVAVIVVVALVAWYFYSMQSPGAATQSSSLGAQTAAAPSVTTADIQADLNQIPDDSSTLKQDSDASAQAVQSL